MTAEYYTFSAYEVPHDLMPISIFIADLRQSLLKWLEHSIYQST